MSLFKCQFFKVIYLIKRYFTKSLNKIFDKKAIQVFKAQIPLIMQNQLQKMLFRLK